MTDILYLAENKNNIRETAIPFVYSLQNQIAKANSTTTYSLNISSTEDFFCEEIYSEFEFDDDDQPTLLISIADTGRSQGEHMSAPVPFSLISSNGKKGNNFFKGFPWEYVYKKTTTIEVKVVNGENVDREFSIMFKGFNLFGA